MNGNPNLPKGNEEEMVGHNPFNSMAELMAYRNMPLDNISALIKNNIPIIMVSGDDDHSVPYCENGVFLQRTYEDAGVELEVYIKPGADYHPHGLENPKPVLDFILRNS